MVTNGVALAQTTTEIDFATLESVWIEFDGVDFTAAVRPGEVVVDGAPLAISWAEPKATGQVEVVLGAKVPSLLREIAPKDRSCVPAGALIVSALVGHPRKSPIGRPIRFVWTDHVALAAFG